MEQGVQLFQMKTGGFKTSCSVLSLICHKLKEEKEQQVVHGTFLCNPPLPCVMCNLLKAGLFITKPEDDHKIKDSPFKVGFVALPD